MSKEIQERFRKKKNHNFVAGLFFKLCYEAQEKPHFSFNK